MFGPTQRLNLTKIVSTHASILLSLNSSFVQFGFTLGALLGGVAIEYFSIHSIMYLDVISTLIAFRIYLYSLKK